MGADKIISRQTWRQYRYMSHVYFSNETTDITLTDVCRLGPFDVEEASDLLFYNTSLYLNQNSTGHN